jgi:hypothetical protein
MPKTNDIIEFLQEYEGAGQVTDELLTSLRTRFTAKLICPHCKYDGTEPGKNGDGFRYLTNQTTFRIVLNPVAAANGNLLVASAIDTYPEDVETDERIECKNCLEEFPVPEDFTEVEFQSTHN